MFKRLSFTVVAMLLGIAVNAQTWVGFDRNEPAAPEFSVINSNDHTVVFNMNLPGMFVEDKVNGSQTC